LICQAGDFQNTFTSPPILNVTGSLEWGLSTLKKMKIREEAVKGAGKQ